jgi:hypothetical protein
MKAASAGKSREAKNVPTFDDPVSPRAERPSEDERFPRLLPRKELLAEKIAGDGKFIAPESEI